MVTIESGMLVALGFSLAGLLACVLAPMYRRRTARLATEALKRAMPLTASEIAADKDRIRAEYAIRIHKLESSLSDSSLETARQLVEINRRDARISALESDVARLGTINEEHENARRVLEMTITERLPKVEQRLSEAKRLLFERDREISALTQAAQRQSSALEEATQINTQQRDELNRLNATLATRAARRRDLPKDQQHEAEIALRTEIEALRARVRDQAQMISRLQENATAPAATATAEPPPVDETGEMARLRSSLSDAEQALQEARANASAGRATDKDHPAAGDVAALQATVTAQNAEIASLKSVLEQLQSASAERPLTVSELSGEDRQGLQTRLRELEAQTGEQMATIMALRAELAAGNEKLERQATYYMDEMRRLGAGTRPTGGFIPAAAPAPASSADQPAKPSLSERISAPRVATVQIASSSAELAHAEPANGHEAPETKSSDHAAGTSAGGDAKASEPAAAPRRQSLLQRITGLEKPVA